MKFNLKNNNLRPLANASSNIITIINLIEYNNIGIEPKGMRTWHILTQTQKIIRRCFYTENKTS